MVCSVLSATALALGLAGCGLAPPVPIELQDNHVPSVAVRASIHPMAWSRGDRPGPGIEVGYERYRAGGTHRLATGEDLVFEGQTVSGPDDVAQDAHVQRVYLAYAHLFQLGANVEFEPFGGFVWNDTRVRLTPSNSALRPEYQLRKWGAIGGVSPRWRVSQALALELRLTALGRDFRYASTNYDLGGLWNPRPTLGLRLGYAWRSDDYDGRDGSIGGDGSGNPAVANMLRLKTRGPSFSLVLGF